MYEKWSSVFFSGEHFDSSSARVNEKQLVTDHVLMHL